MLNCFIEKTIPPHSILLSSVTMYFCAICLQELDHLASVALLCFVEILCVISQNVNGNSQPTITRRGFLKYVLASKATPFYAI